MEADNANKLKDKIAVLPDEPGVYIFKDSAGKIIYIGKAKSLRKRVNSYLGRFLSAKTQALVSKIADIDYIVTASDTKSLLLEAGLIKEKQPYYNISLKDDKSFPFIKISGDEFPIVCICRDQAHLRGGLGGGGLFGPYTDPKLLRQALKIVRKIFGFRSCKVMHRQACLYARLKLCPAPCIGRISKPEYQELINQIKLFLGAKYEELLDRLKLKMTDLAEEKKFEAAAKIRDQINALAVFAQGKHDPLTLTLSPKGRGKGYNELEGLKDLLGLSKLPERIEAFDISNISGKEAAGAMVSFYNGLPDKNNYRRFRIKIAERPNDYAMLKEVVHRRYKRLKQENSVLPDLILIDGGRAHLNTAKREVENLGLSIPIASIAKERENIYVYNNDKCRGTLQCAPAQCAPAAALNLIRRIRDEAHRFALKYHHLLRRKKILAGAHCNVPLQ